MSQDSVQQHIGYSLSTEYLLAYEPEDTQVHVLPLSASHVPWESSRGLVRVGGGVCGRGAFSALGRVGPTVGESDRCREYCDPAGSGAMSVSFHSLLLPPSSSPPGSRRPTNSPPLFPFTVVQYPSFTSRRTCLSHTSFVFM